MSAAGASTFLSGVGRCHPLYRCCRRARKSVLPSEVAEAAPKTPKAASSGGPKVRAAVKTSPKQHAAWTETQPLPSVADAPCGTDARCCVRPDSCGHLKDACKDPSQVSRAHEEPRADPQGSCCSRGHPHLPTLHPQARSCQGLKPWRVWQPGCRGVPGKGPLLQRGWRAACIPPSCMS